MRRFTLSGLVAVTAIAVSAMGVRADVQTSLTPSCLDTDCLEVQFTLEVFDTPTQGSYWYLNNFEFWTVATDWAFDEDGIFEVVGSGSTLYDTDVGLDWYDTNVNGDPTRLDFGGGDKPLALDAPIQITVAFADVGANWTDLRYRGDVQYQVFDENGDPVYDQFGDPVYAPAKGESFDGTVTPEPATLLLLGTGLLGIAGVARRRKNLHQDGEEEL